MPSDDSKISRLLFWWLTLDTEFQRHVHEATIIQGELSPLLRLIPTPDDPTDPVYLAAIAARRRRRRRAAQAAGIHSRGLAQQP